MTSITRPRNTANEVGRVATTARPPVIWRAVATTIASTYGLGVSIYLTLTHYTTIVSLVCPTSGAINCEKVTTSPQSEVFGIPVAVLGLFFFVPMLVLSLPVFWRSSIRLVAIARLALSVTGVGFIAYLLYAELYEIHAICLWCTSVHVVTFLIFVLVVTGWEQATSGWVDQD